MNKELVKKEFEECFAQSPFSNISKESNEYAAMYGFFMSGCLAAQKFMIAEIKKRS